MPVFNAAGSEGAAEKRSECGGTAETPVHSPIHSHSNAEERQADTNNAHGAQGLAESDTPPVATHLKTGVSLKQN